MPFGPFKPSADGNAERPRWVGGKRTFIFAALSSAVGIGNFWRFPSITFQYGGAGFFLPYFIALFFFGVPLLILEIALGQKFQRGPIIAFSAIQKRLGGVGWAQVFSAFVTAIYYTVIVGYALFYFAMSFKKTMPWEDNTDCLAINAEGNLSVINTISYYITNFLEYSNKDDNCRNFEATKESYIAPGVLVCSVITWVLIFLSLFKGIRPLSYIVYPTFLLPALLIIVFMALGISLENSKEGFDMYFKGEGAEIKPKEALEKADIWINAVAQVFFSLSLGVGVMTTYSSYNENSVEQGKPSNILRDAFIIACTDTVLSFLSGFFVFGVVGYLIQEIGFSAFSSYMGGAGLLYGTIPKALNTLSGKNGWSVFFFLTIYLLGIDSSISYVETVVTALNETTLSKKMNRSGIALLVCLVGFLISLAFCCNFAYNLISATDYFLSAYFITFVAVIECMSIGWIFDFKERVLANPALTDPLLYLAAAYWGGLIVLGILGFFAFFEYNYIAIVIFVILLAATTVYTQRISGLGWGDYYEQVFMNGVYRFARGISLQGDKKPTKATIAFEVWFGFCIKYLIPAALYWMLLMSVKFMQDVGAEQNYEVNGFKWWAIGMIFPIIGFFFFALPILKPTTTEEDRDYCKQVVNKEFSAQAAAVGSIIAQKVQLQQIQPVAQDGNSLTKIAEGDPKAEVEAQGPQ